MSESEEKTRVTAIVQKPLGAGDGAPKGNDCLVVIYTKEPSLLGRRFVLDASPIRIGRGTENHIVLDGDSVSRRHAHFEQRSGAWWCVDDGSTNGSYVKDEQIMRESRLGNGDRIKIGPTIFKFLSGQDVEAQYHEEIYRMTIIDGLTQVHVKRYLLESLDKEMMRARRHTRDLSFLMLDIDHFKRINDRHGHLAGLPETNLEGARALAEGLREKIEQSRFVFQGEVIRVTISIGVSMLEGDRTSMDLIQRADEKLYEAKRAGRNRVLAG